MRRWNGSRSPSARSSTRTLIHHLHAHAGYKQSERDEFFDTLQQRYVKKKEVAEKYLVVQMGLSAFVWDPELDDFRAYTWNIHVFPSDMVRAMSCFG
jgi:hypothetical protein